MLWATILYQRCFCDPRGSRIVWAVCGCSWLFQSLEATQNGNDSWAVISDWVAGFYFLVASLLHDQAKKMDRSTVPSGDAR